MKPDFRWQWGIGTMITRMANLIFKETNAGVEFDSVWGTTAAAYDRKEALQNQGYKVAVLTDIPMNTPNRNYSIYRMTFK